MSNRIKISFKRNQNIEKSRVRMECAHGKCGHRIYWSHCPSKQINKLKGSNAHAIFYGMPFISNKNGTICLVRVLNFSIYIYLLSLFVCLLCLVLFDEIGNRPHISRVRDDDCVHNALTKCSSARKLNLNHVFLLLSICLLLTL